MGTIYEKAFIFLLILALVLSLTACKESAAGEGEKFIAPEKYATVILVTINPQFKLYLDENEKVLAVEPINDDAKSISKNIETTKGNLDTVLNSLFITTCSSGFVKNETADIKLDIVESNNTAATTEEILTKAKKATTNSFNALDIKVNIEASASVTETEEVSSENISSVESISSSSSSNNNTVESMTSNSSKNNSVVSTHTHKFSAATCTKPATCSCKATSGKSLGHNYKDGLCTRCKAKDPTINYTSVSKKDGYWSLMYVNNNTLYEISFNLKNELSCNVGLGDSLDNMNVEDKELLKPDCTLFENKYYYIGRGDGDDFNNISESGTTVTITDTKGNKLILNRTAENKMVVKTSPASFSCLGKVPVGATVSFIG